MEAANLTIIKVLKRDIFGKIELASLNGSLVICRNYGASRFFARPIALYLAYRERKILQVMEHLNDDRLPRLLHFGKGLHIRSYLEGEALNRRKTPDRNYYEDARELLDKIHACGVVHNDLEKPENWLVIGENTPGIIDFQLAGFFPKKGKLYRILMREDLRHLIKQKARFSPDRLSGEERIILSNKSFASRMWGKFFKPPYDFVTRKILRYSDRAHSEHSR